MGVGEFGGGGCVRQRKRPRNKNYIHETHLAVSDLQPRGVFVQEATVVLVQVATAVRAARVHNVVAGLLGFLGEPPQLRVE